NAEEFNAFIACQGPNTASIDDFWRMVIQEKVLNIVMLTNLIEKGKGNEQRKVRNWHYRTWPDMDVPQQATPLIGFAKKVKLQQSASTGPLVVHC
ncbi:putative receptor-type tyrosine-protein phosphatase mu, partial [Apostichopus japonicus]